MSTSLEQYRLQAIRGQWTANVGQPWADLAVDLMEEFGTNEGFHLAADVVLAFALGSLRGGIPDAVEFDPAIRRDVKRALREGEEQRKKTWRSLRAKDVGGEGRGYTEAELRGRTTDAATGNTTDATSGRTVDSTSGNIADATAGTTSGQGNGNGNQSKVAIRNPNANCERERKVNDEPVHESTGERAAAIEGVAARDQRPAEEGQEDLAASVQAAIRAAAASNPAMAKRIAAAHGVEYPAQAEEEPESAQAPADASVDHEQVTVPTMYRVAVMNDVGMSLDECRAATNTFNTLKHKPPLEAWLLETYGGDEHD